MCNCRRGGSRNVDRRSFVFGLAPAFALVAWAGASPGRASGASLDLSKPKPDDACPVCGMFVAKFPHWVATVLFQDGVAHHFDGGKDFFKYMLDMPKYASGRSREQIAAMGVTSYYDTALIDARTAFYVIGSDAMGPMGHELVAHSQESDAREFLNDHKGRRVLTFAEITPAILDGLDEGRFE